MVGGGVAGDGGDGGGGGGGGGGGRGVAGGGGGGGGRAGATAGCGPERAWWETERRGSRCSLCLAFAAAVQCAVCSVQCAVLRVQVLRREAGTGVMQSRCTPADMQM